MMREFGVTAVRVRSRIDAIIERDGNIAAAITGRGFAIGYLLACDIWQDLIAAADLAERYDRRVTELLQVINREVDRRRALHHALESCVEIASEAHKEWDADNDPRVGKILIALSGGIPGYRPDIDTIHRVLARARVDDATPAPEEGERQLLLMALAHLSIERPGFDFALNLLALKYDNNKEGRAELYDNFRALRSETLAVFTERECPKCQLSIDPDSGWHKPVCGYLPEHCGWEGSKEA